MINKNIKYSYSDLEIMPTSITTVKSRSECDVKCNSMLPIFTAPMDSVVDEHNYNVYKENGIIPIIHRNVSLEKRISFTKKGCWVAYSQEEYEKLFCDNNTDIYDDADNVLSVLIDTAVGHMSHIIESVPKAKDIALSKNHRLVVMYGNIANPKTIEYYCKYGIDYARCSIGRGTCCITSSQTAIGCGNGSLIDETYTCRNLLYKRYIAENPLKDPLHSLFKHFTKTHIIADGGIRNFSDAIVALALGADYVMIGSVFGSFFESCADFVSSEAEKNKGMLLSVNYEKPNRKFMFAIPNNMSEAIAEYNKIANVYNLPNLCMPRLNTSYILPDKMCTVVLTESDMEHEELKRWIIKYITLKKSVHGMSTKEAQIGGIISRGNEVDVSKLKTSEGKTITVDVKYTIHQWVDNFTSYLKSAMSYTNCKKLSDFIGNVTLVVKSPGTMNTVNK